MKDKKIIILFISTLVFAIVLSSVYLTYANQNITLTFGLFAGSNWNVPNGNSYKIYEDAISRFETIYPNVDIKFESGIRKKDYSEWISQKMVQEKTPDVFLSLGEDLSTFADIGILENLDSYIKDDKDLHKNDYYATSLAAGEYQNHQYALPLESVPTLMFVNKTLLEKEGITLPNIDWTWDDFYQICKQVTRDTNGDGELNQFGAYGYDWSTALYSNGAKLFSDDGSKTYLNTPKVKESILFAQEILLLNNSVNVSAKDFDEGNVAFCPMQFSQYRAYMPYPWRVKKYSNFEWDCISLPAGPNGDNVSKVDTLSVGMSSKSKHKKYAWEFLKMLTHDETTQKSIFTHSQGVSTLKKVNESEDVISTMAADNPGQSTFEIRILSDVMKNGMVQYQFKKYEESISMISNEIYRITYEDRNDITTAINTLQHKMELYIKE